MNRAAETVYKALLEDGHQKSVLEIMQTRAELYDYLGYHEYEEKLDRLFAAGATTEKED
jgi:methylisocitrate lyase